MTPDIRARVILTLPRRNPHTLTSVRPHLLYVAWGFPPCRGSGVYRALETANAFARDGWDVTVLTVERDTFTRYTGVDESLESLIDPRITVVRTPFSWPYLDEVSDHSLLRRSAPRVWHKLRTQRDLLAFPEKVYGPWRHAVETAALRIHRARPVDLTLATANPATAWTAAHVLHTEHSVPYVLDQRDAWTLDVFSGRRLFDDGSRQAMWESKLFRNATQVWFVNDAIRHWHEKAYPFAAERMRTVPNGWDQATDPMTGQHHNRPLTFGYLGTITRKVPIAPLVEGWIRAGWTSEVMRNSRMELHGHLGFYNAEDAVLRRAVDNARRAGVFFGGSTQKADIPAVYARFDALVLALGSGRYVTSGKVYEYMATGLPIVSVHEPSNAASDVLRDYPFWFPAASVKPDDIALALLQASDVAPLNETERDKARAVGMNYRRDRILGPRVQELRAMATTRAANAS